MVSGLQRVKENCQDLLEKVDMHLHQIGKLIEDPLNGNIRLFRIEHEHLEDEIADFVKAFRKNRKNVFKITEYVIESEKLEGFLEK